MCVVFMLEAEEKCHPSDDPLCWLLFGLQIEGPHKRGASLSCFVQRAPVHVAKVLLVNWDGLDKDDRHGRCQLLQPCLLNSPALDVPPCALHEQAANIGTFPWWGTEVLAVLLSDVTLEAHPVQRPLILTSHGLHDSREEGLRVEEASQPDGCRHLEVSSPILELLDPQQEVCKPVGEVGEGGVGLCSPLGWNLVQKESILQVLHVSTDGQFTLQSTRGTEGGMHALSTSRISI